MVLGADDRFSEIVDGVDVDARVVGRRLVGLDLLQLDAVRPEVATAHEMDDQAEVLLPDRGGYRPAEIGRKDQLGPKKRDHFFGDRVSDVELDRQLVPARAKLTIQTLAQAVEGMAQQVDTHQ